MMKLTTPSAQILPLTELPVDIDLLCQEAAADGFQFMEKLRNGWRSGTNRFDASGEAFLGMFRDSDLVAVGGLNIDPYISDSQVGRLRHLYVKKNERRKGYASQLVRALVHLAHPSFHTVRLLTDTYGGAAFYESLGFERVSSTTASHELILRP